MTFSGRPYMDHTIPTEPRERKHKMDYDLNNYDMLNKGAFYAEHSEVSGGWKPMDSAPHDGTVIEIRCTYGVAPWYGLYQWKTHFKGIIESSDGKLSDFEYDDPKGRWAKVNDDNSSFTDDKSFSWRPYSSSITGYVDPTGGAQNSPAYWRGASARVSGRPVDYFEHRVERNISHEKSWWEWLTAIFR